MAGAMTTAAQPATPKMIGIQVGAVSFVDEGVDKVLDVFQQDASINTLFVATFTYGRGIAGRQLPGQPLPDHGKQEYDASTFHGGRSSTGTPSCRTFARRSLATTTCSRRCFHRPANAE